MRNNLLRAATASVAIICSIGGCSKNEEQPPPAQPGQYPPYQQQPQQYPAGQQPYPAQQQPYPPQQPGYPPQQPGYPPQQQPTYPATPGPSGGTTSPPPGVKFPCQTDAQCLSHRCNVQLGNCSFPCQSNDDCQPGFQCVAPACVPTLPQQ